MTINVNRGDATRLHAHWILYFHEVVRIGSIRGAAKHLNVAPSVISRQIKSVEAVIGERLLDRVSNRLVPTPAGEAVAQHASAVLRGMGSLQATLDDLRGLRRGSVAVSATPSAASSLLPGIVGPFLKAHPGIDFACAFTGSPDVAARVAAGEADLGLAFDPPVSPALRTVIAVPLPLGAVMSPENAFADRATLRLYDLVDSNETLIFPDAMSPTRAILEDILRKSALAARPAVTSSDRAFVHGLVGENAGVAFQTPLGIERELDEGTLAFVPLMEPGLKPRALAVLIPARRPPSRVANLMTEAARASVSALLP